MKKELISSFFLLTIVVSGCATQNEVSQESTPKNTPATTAEFICPMDSSIYYYDEDKSSKLLSSIKNELAATLPDWKVVNNHRDGSDWKPEMYIDSEQIYPTKNEISKIISMLNNAAILPKGRQIPYSEIVNQCEDRAHLSAAFVWSQRPSWVIGKAFIRGRLSTANKLVKWGYHVAPYIVGKNNKAWIIDPSFNAKEPMTIVDWIKQSHSGVKGNYTLALKPASSWQNNSYNEIQNQTTFCEEIEKAKLELNATYNKEEAGKTSSKKSLYVSKISSNNKVYFEGKSTDKSKYYIFREDLRDKLIYAQDNKCSVSVDYKKVTLGRFYNRVLRIINKETHFLFVQDVSISRNCLSKSNSVPDWDHLSAQNETQNEKSIVGVEELVTASKKDILPENKKTSYVIRTVAQKGSGNCASLSVLKSIIFMLGTDQFLNMLNFSADKKEFTINVAKEKIKISDSNFKTISQKIKLKYQGKNPNDKGFYSTIVLGHVVIGKVLYPNMNIEDAVEEILTGDSSVEIYRALEKSFDRDGKNVLKDKINYVRYSNPVSAYKAAKSKNKACVVNNLIHSYFASSGVFDYYGNVSKLRRFSLKPSKMIGKSFCLNKK